MKTFRDLHFKPFGSKTGNRRAELEFTNGHMITVTSMSAKLPMLYAVYVTRPAPELRNMSSGPAFSGNINCTRDKVDYLMRLVQNDPEKVMSQNC